MTVAQQVVFRRRILIAIGQRIAKRRELIRRRAERLRSRQGAN